MVDIQFYVGEGIYQRSFIYVYDDRQFNYYIIFEVLVFFILKEIMNRFYV